MVSHENRFLPHFFVVLILIFTVSATMYVVGSTIVVFLLFVGIGVLGSQIYLAATGDDIAPRTRIRFGVLVTLVIVVGYSNTATSSEWLPIVIFGFTLVVFLLIYEAVSGYLTSIDS